MVMATTSPTETTATTRAAFAFAATLAHATAFGPQPVNALTASEYADHVKKVFLSAHEQREYDETEWLLILADAIEAIEAMTPTSTPAKQVQTILQALVDEAFTHETQATTIVSQLGDELVRASQWVLSDHEKIASLQEALHETQQELEQCNAQVAALEAVLMEAKANSSANEKADSHSDTASSTGSSTDSERAPARGLRKTTSSSSSSGSTRPAWISSTRGKMEQASRPAASRVRARASASAAISTASTTTTARGPTTTAARTKTAAQPTTLPAKPKKVSKPTQPTRPKKQGPTPTPKRMRPQPQPPAPLPHLEWSVLECAAEQARAGHSLSLILRQLQDIATWRVGFEEDELWVLPGDRTSTTASPAPIDSASVVHVLVTQTKLLDALKRDCHGKLRGVSHVSRDRPLLVERQQKLLGEVTHVRTLVADLIATLCEVAWCEEDDVADQEHVRVWPCRMTVAPKPTMSTVREQLTRRAMVDVSTAALQSVEVAVRGFHMECLGEWAASLETDVTKPNDVEIELGAIVLGEVKLRTEKQAEACQRLYTSASLAIKFKDAITKIEDKLAFFSMALARSQDLYWCEGLLEQLGSESEMETIDVHTA